MFKALDQHDGHEIIILDQSPSQEMDTLREQAKANRLCCPVCKQPVSVKAGEHRRRHFAHKDLGSCPSSHEPPELLQARAVLYEWLRTKFSDGVTLEKRVEGLDLPRSIDCWVERPRGVRLAYWIVHASVSPEDREILSESLTHGEIRANFVFLSTLMQRNDKKRHVLNLRPTERELMVQSELDAPHGPLGRSIHYLDLADHRLITFRGMHCIELPQQYQGQEISSAMSSVQVRPSSGEFVHPGEWPRLEEWKQAERAREEQRAREAARLAEEVCRRAEEARRRAEVRAAIETQRRAAARQAPTPEPALESITSAPQPDPFAWKPKTTSSLSADREGTCVFCGQRTRDWWTLNPDGTCKCRSCRAAGRA